MKALLLLQLVAVAYACISSAPRQYSAQQPAYGYQSQQQSFVAPAARAAAAENVVPDVPIATGHLTEGTAAGTGAGLGERVSLTEFSSNGYNAEGGGPVSQGQALQCDFDGRPCCWANAPTPEDQLDWQWASGTPERIASNVTLNGRYLLAYAEGAAPSDEAQFASCSIACASSPITVRATHYQTKSVLLQVCQRESFPQSIDFNPLLNCQEFPNSGRLQHTELTLPKASLVDIVIVASSLIEKSGSFAILDNIEVVYESDPAECPQVPRPTQSQTSQAGQNGRQEVEGSVAGTRRNPSGGSGLVNLDGASDADFTSVSNSGAAGAAGASGAGAAGASASAARGSFTSVDTATGEEISVNGIRTSSSSGSARALGAGIKTTEETGPIVPSKLTGETKELLAASCLKTKCTFESNDTCSYVDQSQLDTTQKLFTNFHIVKGQFMNRVTGVKESPEGDFYAATFLYPREKAVLSSDVGYIDQTQRIRFKYYEGTHGVQLKGCCDSVEKCPFGTDKFVTVTDREWKHGDFSCDKGTQKILFLCENTRTNQGACALDDVQVVDSQEPDFSTAKPLC